MFDLTTEARNPSSTAIDSLQAIEIVELMNGEDARIADAIATQSATIATAIELIAERLRLGGRLIYIGAGTSGRLGVLDASECPPTFSTPPEMVVGLIAGGPQALTRSVEGAEDHREHGERELRGADLTANDVVVGIATSGRTPYVIGGLEYALAVGACAIGLSCNVDSELEAVAQLMIVPVVGPEIISGSTRLKAGTATKMVLNMLTTGAMVRLGKTYGNLMVDLTATNQKLMLRSERIVSDLTGLEAKDAQKLLDGCGGEVKTAIVSQTCMVSVAEARQLLVQSGGHLRRTLEDHISPTIKTSGRDDTQKLSCLILGVDGGGTKTVAWLATSGAAGQEEVLGRGIAGGSNLRSLGLALSISNLDRAVAGAFTDAGLRRRTVNSACLALAGVDRQADRAAIQAWADSRGLATRTVIVHDALPVLYAGTANGWGVALIAGTGSFAVGRDVDGKTARCGGWGHLIGDEGSGYAIALAGLRAAARFADGRGQATVLLSRFLTHLGLTNASEIVSALYDTSVDRAQIAALAQLVFESSDVDDMANQIIDQAAHDLAGMLIALTRQLDFHSRPVPLALSGGVLLNQTDFRDRLQKELMRIGFKVAEVTTVSDPVSGALFLARQRAEPTQKTQSETQP